MKIHFKCQHCGVKVNVPASGAGMNSKCPQCGGITVVPRLKEQADRGTPGSSARSLNDAAGAHSEQTAAQAATDAALKSQEPERIPCPYCAEQILPNSRKCRFCGEFFKTVAAYEAIERNSISEPKSTLGSDTLEFTDERKVESTVPRWNFDSFLAGVPWYRIAATLVIAAIKVKLQAELPGGSPGPLVSVITFAIIMLICFLAVRWGLYSTYHFSMRSTISWGVLFFMAGRLLAPIDYAFLITWCAFREEPEDSAYEWSAPYRWLFLIACILACLVGTALISEQNRVPPRRSSSSISSDSLPPSYVAFSVASPLGGP